VKHRSIRTALVALLPALALAGCGSGPSAESESGQVNEKVTLRLGYFPNITHAAALVGMEKGIFAEHLGPNVTLRTSTFAAGPAAVEAVFSGAIDATYVGPNPAINAFTKSNGQAIRIIAGATSGGAFLVVKPDIKAAGDLKGKKIASPQLGNTQDVALRTWLKANGLKTDPQGGGDVSVVPQENAQTLETFKSAAISGAWVPEPWATRLVQEGNGKVLVDEATLWPEGRYVTTQLIVRTAFLKDHADVVARLLEGHVAATAFLNQSPAEARTLANQAITKLTGKALPAQVIDAAWKNLVFTNDPVASSLRKGATDAQAAGLLTSVKLDGIYDLAPLNTILVRLGQPEVKS